jgi:hypothetical protein
MFRFPKKLKITKINGNIVKFLWPIIIIILVVILIPLGIPSSSDNSLRLMTEAEISPQAQRVETGIYVMNIYDLNPSTNTHYVDFYLWFKWKGEIDPTKNIEFTNSVEDWGVTITPLYEEPEKLPDGNFYQALRVESRFVDSLSFEKYPLDEEKLNILLENSVYTSDKLVYLGDKEQSGYSHRVNLPGWEIVNFELSSFLYQYDTNFGDTRLKNGTQHSILQYSLNISRPISFFLWKLLLPLIIVLATGWGSLLLNPDHSDSRITLPVTALLTAVFLQQTYSASLPDVGYLVLLDKIYVVTYILIFISIIEAIMTAGWLKNDNIESYNKIVKIDHLILGFQAFVFCVVVVILIWLTNIS